jgi:phosphohistidine phosphatase SixA
VREVREVAAALREQLCHQPAATPITLGQVWTGDYAHTRESARIVAGTLGPITSSEFIDLDPATFWPHPREALHAIIDRLRTTLNSYRANAGANSPNAVIVVGHQPQLSWIAQCVLGKGLPVTTSEVICLEISEEWLRNRRTYRNAVRWTIEPRDKETLSELRDKIKSKMDVTKVLGGFIFATLAILLDTSKIKSLIDDQVLWNGVNLRYNAALVAAVLLILAGSLYMATLFAYDRLLMPIRFWSEALDGEQPRWLVARPPSSSAYVLYQNMMRIWTWMFLPATVCVICGFFIFTAAVFRPGSFLGQSAEVTLGLTAGALAVGVVWFFWHYRRFGPRLGTED